MPSRLTLLDDTGRYREITGVILAGGKSSRMGSDKAFLTHNGVPFIEILLKKLRDIFCEITVSATDTEKFSSLAVPVIPDLYNDCGPLAGIHAALNYAETSHIFVVSCDVPMISSTTIRNIVRSARSNKITICQDSIGIHPLCGIYPRSMKPVIQKYLLSGKRSVRGVVSLGNIQTFTDCSGPAELWNINTPADYDRILNRH